MCEDRVEFKRVVFYFNCGKIMDATNIVKMFSSNEEIIICAKDNDEISELVILKRNLLYYEKLTTLT